MDRKFLTLNEPCSWAKITKVSPPPTKFVPKAETIEYFKIFIKNYNITDIFLKEMKKHRPERILNTFLEKTESKFFIYRAFPWLTSEEGELFWTNIHNKWQIICKKHNL